MPNPIEAMFGNKKRLAVADDDFGEFVVSQAAVPHETSNANTTPTYNTAPTHDIKGYALPTVSAAQGLFIPLT